MNDENAGVFALGAWLRKISGAAGIGQGFADYSRIAFRQNVGVGIIVFEKRQEGGCSRCAARKNCELFHEFAAVHAAVGETIKEVDVFLVHDGAPFLLLKERA